MSMKLSKEHKINQEVKKHLPSTAYKKGSIPWNKGKSPTQETRNKLSISHKGWSNFIGKKHTEETKNKISLINMKKHYSIETEFKKGFRISPNTEFKKGCKAYSHWTGKKMSLETRKKMSQNQPKGSNRWNWKGGISKEKGYLHVQRAKRRALFQGGGKLNIKTVQLVYEDNIKKYGTLTCYLCLMPIEFKKDHLEHKIPLSRGGSNEYNNLAIACQHCNNKKSFKTEKEYRRDVLFCI